MPPEVLRAGIRGSWNSGVTYLGMVVGSSVPPGNGSAHTRVDAGIRRAPAPVRVPAWMSWRLVSTLASFLQPCVTMPVHKTEVPIDDNRLIWTSFGGHPVQHEAGGEMARILVVDDEPRICR